MATVQSEKVTKEMIGRGCGGMEYYSYYIPAFGRGRLTTKKQILEALEAGLEVWRYEKKGWMK